MPWYLWILTIHFSINIFLLVVLRILGGLGGFPIRGWKGWIRGLLIGWIEVVVAILVARALNRT